MSAQDEAVARAALRKGLLGVDRLRQAQARAGARSEPLVQALAAGGHLAPAAVAALLRDLARTAHRCGGCGAQATWDQLAALPTLLCPRCGGTLDPPGVPGSGRTAPPPGGPPPARVDLDDYVSDDTTGSDAGAVAPDEATDRAAPGTRPSGSWGPASGPPPAGSGSAPPRASGAPPPRASGAAPAAAPRPADDDGPRRIGPYLLERELGRGSNGVVWLARREGGGPPVALKALKDDDADEETVKRFDLEAAIARKLRHPGIVAVLDAGEDRGRRWLVMEYCPGPTLKAHAAKGRLPAADAARLVRDLADAMAVAHAQGVLHRDLKPANIILEEGSGRPRVTDFGLARDRSLLRSMTRSGDVIGTPFYMAPEQLKGRKDIDARVDVWALGVLLYELAVGRRPFDANSFVELAQKVEAGRWEPPSAAVGAPRALDALLRKALAVDPAERLRDAGALRDALDRALPGLERGDADGARRARVLAGAAAAVALAAGGASLAVALRRGPAALPPPAATTTAAPPPATAAGAPPPTAAADVRQAIDAAARRPPDEALATLAALRPSAAADPALRRALERAEARATARAALAAATAAAARRDALAAAAALADARRPLETADDPGLEVAVALAGAAEAARVGRLEDALEALDGPRGAEALAERAGDASARAAALLLRGQALERLGRLEPALVVLREAARVRAPRPATAPQVARAAVARLAGDASAPAIAAQALVDAPEDPAALLEAARCHLEVAGDLARAGAALEAARRAAPGEPLVDLLTARHRLGAGVASEALAALERAFAAWAPEHPEPEALALRACLRLAVDRDARGARADVDRLLARCPVSIDGLVLRGHLRGLDGRVEEAAADRQAAWRIAGERGPRCERLLAPIGPEAVTAFRRVVTPDARPPQPERPPPRTPTATESPMDALAEGLFPGLREAAAARAALADAYEAARVEGSPPAALARALDARAAAATADPIVRGDLRRALEAAALGRTWSDVQFPLGRAARFAASDLGVQRVRARLFLARDRLREAREALDALRDLGLPPAELLTLEGELAWRAGRPGAALAAFGRAQAAGQGGLEARYAGAAAALLRLDVARARALATEALALDPGHAPSCVVLATACLHEQALGEARKALARAQAVEGATDGRVGALRLALAAASNLVAADRVADELPDLALLAVGDGPGGRLWAADALAAGPAPGPKVARGLLERARALDPARPDVALLAARLALLLDEGRDAVLAQWRAARELEPEAPIPDLDRDRFRRRFGQDAPP